MLTPGAAYDYVEVTREVLNEDDVDRGLDSPWDSPKDQHNKSIPLMDTRMFAGHGNANGHLTNQ